MAARSVLIVGAGPAGAALAYLLARRGVAVTLLVKHLDLARAFRGEGLQPSGVDALVQTGFAEKLASLPQAKVNVIELHRGGRGKGTRGRFTRVPRSQRLMEKPPPRQRPHSPQPLPWQDRQRSPQDDQASIMLKYRP